MGAVPQRVPKPSILAFIFNLEFDLAKSVTLTVAYPDLVKPLILTIKIFSQVHKEFSFVGQKKLVNHTFTIYTFR